MDTPAFNATRFVRPALRSIALFLSIIAISQTARAVDGVDNTVPGIYDCSAGQTHATNRCVADHANDDGVWDALMLTSPCQALNRFACRRIDTGFYQGGFGRPEFQPVPITPFPV